MSIASTATQPSALQFKPVLILSSGRCGSTMISEILNTHPGVLSMSEFFTPLGTEGLAIASPDGERMWKIYSRQSAPYNALLRDGVVADEALYPYAAPESRFKADTMPPILSVALPHLTSKFEPLFDELEPVVHSQPQMPLADHYRFLFEYLARKFGRKVWVERSGGSLMVAAKLMKLFPEARIIHVYRDGRDTAMSMSSHHPFKVLVAIMKRVRRYGLRPTRQFLSSKGSILNVWLEYFVFNNLDVMKLLRDTPVSLDDFGALWNEMIMVGEKVFADLPPERLLKVKFEDVQNFPREKLAELIRFIDPSLEDSAWLDKAATIPRTARSKFKTLPTEQQKSLTEICGPGLDVLGYPR